MIRPPTLLLAICEFFNTDKLKTGMIGKALDLAFKTEQFSALDLIARELNSNSDPLVLERAAHFFSTNQRDDKAVELLAYAKKASLPGQSLFQPFKFQYSDAVALCRDRNVVITEELDAILTPPKIGCVTGGFENTDLLS